MIPKRLGVFGEREDAQVFATLIDYSGYGNYELMFVEVLIRRKEMPVCFVSLKLSEFLLLYDVLCGFYDLFFDEEDGGSNDDDDSEDPSGGGQSVKNARVVRTEVSFAPERLYLN